MKKLYFVLSLVLLSSSLAFAEENQSVVLKKTAPKSLSFSSDAQWISGIGKVDTAGLAASSSFSRFNLGTKYIFSEIAYVTASFPFGFFHSSSNYSALGSNFSQMSSTEFITDRVKLGIDGKLFEDTMLGQISWNGMVYLPTIYGKAPYNNRFYNHMDISVGLSNLYHVSHLPAYLLSSFSYISKFSSTYNQEQKDYGDEFSGSLGGSYNVTSSINTSLRFQGSYVKPAVSVINKISMPTKSSAMAVHVVPGFSIPVDNNFSIRGVSRVLLYRSKIDNQDTGEMWGNFEDEGTLSILIGARLGIL